MNKTIDVQNSVEHKPRALVKQTVSATLLLYDIIAMGISFMLALFTAVLLKDAFLPEIYNKPLSDYKSIYALIFIWMCPLVLFVFFSKGHYTQRIPWWSQVQHILVICTVAFIIDGFMRFALKMSFSRLMIGLSWIYVFVFILMARQFIYRIARKNGVWSIPTILIGDTPTISDILHAFSSDPYTGYDVKLVCLLDQTEDSCDLDIIPETFKDVKLLCNETDYKEYIIPNTDHFFVISLETFRGQERDKLIKILNDMNAIYAVAPPLSRINLFEMEARNFFGYDLILLHSKNSVETPISRFAKRSMDVLLSVILLPILVLVIAIVGILLKLEGQGGSIFYGGERIGRKGKKFNCWKFRTMEPNSNHLLYALLERDPEAKAQWEKFRKLKQEDPRVQTKTARFIRKTSLDELPQIWNVLKGDMSFVGPRPILEDEAKLFGDAISYYLRVRPGITGLWQVSGRNNASFERRVYWDSWYVRNWSVWGDIVILIKTLRVVLCRSGAY